MGVQLINLGKRDAVVGIARNAEAGREAEEIDAVDGDADAVDSGSVDADTVEAVVEGTEPSAGEHEE